MNLVYDGFMYTTERKYKTTTNWVCNKNSNTTLRCPGRCVTSNDSIKLSRKEHNHDRVFKWIKMVLNYKLRKQYFVNIPNKNLNWIITLFWIPTLEPFKLYSNLYAMNLTNHFSCCLFWQAVTGNSFVIAKVASIYCMAVSFIAKKQNIKTQPIGYVRKHRLVIPTIG